MSDPKHIYLGPACQKDGDGREWCEDDVWPECECGCSSVKYMLESDAQSQLAALREELAVANHEIESRISAEVGAIEALQETQQRLADAERRNAELEKDAARWNFFSSVANELQAFPHSWGKMTPEKMNHMCDEAMTKPTESGASE
jgi:polyhydroxyalkanoate synthesis regulator phasin